MKGFVYTLTCPIHNRVVYVGSTMNEERRRHDHLIGNSQSTIGIYCRALKEQGKEIIFETVEECEVDNMAFIEKYYMEKYDSHFLLNTNIPNPSSKKTWADFISFDRKLKLAVNELFVRGDSKRISEKSGIRYERIKRALKNNYGDPEVVNAIAMYYGEKVGIDLKKSIAA